MIDQTVVDNINNVIKEYFSNNTAQKIVPVKELMPDFIKAGIFSKDHKKGMPIRRVLRELDQSEQLTLVPNVYAERKDQAVYWYFVSSEADIPTTAYKQTERKPDSKKNSFSIIDSDEAYVIDLCDEILGKKANRQKRFGFLLGDVHKDGKTQTRLPVDAYYDALQLVIEYRDVRHFKASNSSIARDEQRKIYDQRREELLPENKIDLVVIAYSSFKYDGESKIIRNAANDKKIVKKALAKFIKK